MLVSGSAYPDRAGPRPVTVMVESTSQADADLEVIRPQTLHVPRSVRIAYALTVILFLGYAAHAATNVGGDGLDPLFQKWVNDAVPAGCALVCLARARRVRAERGAWLFIGLGIASWAAGNVFYSLYVIDVLPLPIPSVADGLWLAQYPLTLLAVLFLMRARHPSSGARVTPAISPPIPSSAYPPTGASSPGTT